jgi:preprotein translocase subunit SecE
MSRALRRQQAQGPKEPRDNRRGGLNPRPSGPRDTRGAKAPTPTKRRMRLKVPGWLEEIISELKKVTWPTREETAYLTMVVIIVAVIAGVALGLVDIFFNWLIDNLLVK